MKVHARMRILARATNRAAVPEIERAGLVALLHYVLAWSDKEIATPGRKKGMVNITLLREAALTALAMKKNMSLAELRDITQDIVAAAIDEMQYDALIDIINLVEQWTADEIDARG